MPRGRRPTGRVTDGSGTRMCVNVGAAGSCRVKPRWNQACTVSTPSDTVCLWSADRPCRPPRSSARRRRLCRPARDPTCVKAGKARTAKPSSRHNRKVGIRAVKSPQKLGVHDVNEQGLWASRRANMFTMSSTSTTSAKTPAPSLRSERAECRTTTRRLTCWWDLQLGPRCPAAFPR